MKKKIRYENETDKYNMKHLQEFISTCNYR
jgi:hypothetical protein